MDIGSMLGMIFGFAFFVTLIILLVKYNDFKNNQREVDYQNDIECKENLDYLNNIMLSLEKEEYLVEPRHLTIAYKIRELEFRRQLGHVAKEEFNKLMEENKKELESLIFIYKNPHAFAKRKWME